MTRSTILPIALLAAGALSGCDVILDTDGDFLLDEFEVLIGTDPESADTDGDGFDDADEYLRYFSPLKDDDYPYEGGYPRGPLPDNDTWDQLKDDADADQGRGWNAGNFSQNFTVVDQHGEELKLKRFYGEVVLVDISAEWCGPCKSAALGMEDEYQTLSPDGVMYFTFLADGMSQGSAAVADRWIQWPTGEYDGGPHPYGNPGQSGDPISFAVVEDAASQTNQEASRPWLNQTGFFPSFVVIDRHHNIQFVDGGHETAVALVEELMEEDRPAVEYPMPENLDEVWAALRGEE